MGKISIIAALSLIPKPLAAFRRGCVDQVGVVAKKASKSASRRLGVLESQEEPGRTRKA